MWKDSLVKYFWALAFLRWVGLRKSAGIFPLQSTKDISAVFSHVTLPPFLINKIWDHLANCNHRSEYCDWMMFFHLKNKSQHFSPHVCFINVTSAPYLSCFQNLWCRCHFIEIKSCLLITQVWIINLVTPPSICSFFLRITATSLALDTEDQSGFYWVKIKTCKVVQPGRQNRAIYMCLVYNNNVILGWWHNAELVKSMALQKAMKAAFPCDKLSRYSLSPISVGIRKRCSCWCYRERDSCSLTCNKWPFVRLESAA